MRNSTNTISMKCLRRCGLQTKNRIKSYEKVYSCRYPFQAEDLQCLQSYLRHMWTGYRIGFLPIAASL